MNKKKVSLKKGYNLSPILVLFVFSVQPLRVSSEDLKFEGIQEVILKMVDSARFIDFLRYDINENPNSVCSFLENYFDQYINEKSVEARSSIFNCYVGLYEETCY